MGAHDQIRAEFLKGEVSEEAAVEGLMEWCNYTYLMAAAEVAYWKTLEGKRDD